MNPMMMNLMMMMMMMMMMMNPMMMNPNPNPNEHLHLIASVLILLNLQGCDEFLSIRIELISGHDLNLRGCCRSRNNRAESIAVQLHPFFAAISLCMRACICEKLDEAFG
jgi:hypothetical protein